MPIAEFYWRIPTYSENKEKAAALELFFNYLNDNLKKSLVEDFKVAADVAMENSLWNRSYGHLRISVIANKNISEEKLINTVNYEVKYLATTDFSTIEKEIEKNRQKLLADAAVFNIQSNVIDSMNLVSNKVAAGYNLDFIKKYDEALKNVKCEDIQSAAKEIFKLDPEVISVLKPKEKAK